MKNAIDQIVRELKALRSNKPDEYRQVIERAKGKDVIDPEFANNVLAADKIITRTEKKKARTAQ